MTKTNKIIFVIVALDILSVALMYFTQLIPIFLIQISVFIYLVAVEILKKGLCPKNDDVKIIYLSALVWSLVLGVSMIWIDREFLQLISYFLILVSMFRLLIPRLVYYYYKHGVF